MKCGQIVVINGSIPKLTGSNGLRTVITGVPIPISNGATNSAVGSLALSNTNGQSMVVKVNDSTLTAFCSVSYTHEYSIIYLTDE